MTSLCPRPAMPDTDHLEILDRETLAPAMLAYLGRDAAATPPYNVRV